MNKRQVQALRTKLGNTAKSECANYGCDSCPFATCIIEIQTDRIESNTCPYFVKNVLPGDAILYNEYLRALPATHPLKKLTQGTAAANAKECARCKLDFIATSNRSKYCSNCRANVVRKQSRESKANSRLDSQSDVHG